MRYIVYTQSGNEVGSSQNREAAHAWAEDMYKFRGIKCFVDESGNGTERKNQKSGVASC